MPDLLLAQPALAHAPTMSSSHPSCDCSTLQCDSRAPVAIPAAETVAHEALLAAVERVVEGWRTCHWVWIVSGLADLRAAHDQYLAQFPD